jgi:hypothetical protein
MDEAADVGLRGRQRQCSGRVQAAGLKLAPFSPVTDLGRTVEHQIGASRGLGARAGISQIAAENFDALRVEEFGIAARAHEGPNVIAAGPQSFNQMTSQEAGGPGD